MFRRGTVTFAFLMLAAIESSAALPAAERDALMALYNSSTGASWTKRDGWLGASGSECSWSGIQCDANQTTVLAIELSENNLVGTLTPLLAALTNLRKLDVSGNQLTGPITANFRALTGLEEINVSSNLFSGSIPREIAGAPNLKILNVLGNRYSEIPPELMRMSSLIELNVGSNRLTSIPSDIANLENLEVFIGYVNRFSGTFPLALTTLKKLRVLDLEINQLGGPLPTEIGNMKELRDLDLSRNLFTGPLPASLGTLTKLEDFTMWYNNLDGQIPPEIGSLPELRSISFSSNRLTGPIPDSFRNLTKLEQLSVGYNDLTGPIPSWLGTLTSLRVLSISDNDFTGTIPSNIWNLTNLYLLVVGGGQITGAIPPEIGNLKKLEFLIIGGPLMSGPLPPAIGELRLLEYLSAFDGGLTGTLPRELFTLTKLTDLSLDWNQFEGPLPPDIGNLVNLESLGLGGNRFTGNLPREIGNLTKVTELDLEDNAFRGAIPQEITLLTALRNGSGLNIGYNALYSDDPLVRDFVNQKYHSPIDSTQTLTPANLRVASVTDRSATLEWDPIAYSFGPGGNQVVVSTAPNGPPVAVATTEAKYQTSIVVRGLQPEKTYYFTVAAVSHPEYRQRNLRVSDASAPVSATTRQRILSPPDVQMIAEPGTLLQIDGVAPGEERLILTNFGDTPTTISINLSAEFVTVEPRSFPLAGGASQIVTVRGLSQPIGTYYGHAIADGDGTHGGIFIWLIMFSTTRPTGIVRAEAVDTRVEVAGVAGSDSVGQARFRNVGTATLVGILVSDQPWVVPDDFPVFIEPGRIRDVTFRVVRSRRPPGADGALVANLSLIYVDGGSSAGYTASDTPSGVSVAKVTVVDVSKPALSSSAIPGSLPDQVAYFLTGVASFTRDDTSFVSDVSLLNKSAARAMNDVRLYYTPAGAQQTTVASLSPIPATHSVTLANVVTNVYSIASQVGSLQIRSDDWQSLIVQAKLLGLSTSGTVAGDVPTLRSDRSLRSGEILYLTGVRKSSTTRTDIYVQETAGSPAIVEIEFIDQNGNSTGDSGSLSITPFGMIEIADAVPQGAVTVVMTNSDIVGRIAAYARVFDQDSGDHWSIVDWSRQQAFKLGETLRVPLVDGGSQSQPRGKRRRAASHAAIPRGTTDVTLFNPTTSAVHATLQIFDSDGSGTRREITVGPRKTLTLPNVGADAKTPTAQAVITPVRPGELVATARTTRTSGPANGAGVPVLAAASGLRIGRSQIFSNIPDSTSATVAAAQPGTYRTSFGLVETGGASAVVRARIYLDEGRSLASSAIYRDFQIGAGQQIVVDELVRAIVGASRDTALGDLHNLQLRIEVIEGRGSVVPFIVITDNATGDSLLRLE